MSETPFLEPEEIENMTGKKYRPAQIKVLKALGTTHKVRPDGSIAILREHVTREFGGTAAAPARGRAKVSAPNWAAI